MTKNTPQSNETKQEQAVKPVRRASDQEVKPASNAADMFKLCIAAAVVAGSIWVFYNALSLPSYLRILAPVFGVVVGLLIVFYWCGFGRRLIAYVRDSVTEFKKVVWPARNDAFRMTVFVIIFVTILAAFIYMADSVISWLFYDVLLKRG